MTTTTNEIDNRVEFRTPDADKHEVPVNELHVWEWMEANATGNSLTDMALYLESIGFHRKQHHVNKADLMIFRRGRDWFYESALRADRSRTWPLSGSRFSVAAHPDGGFMLTENGRLPTPGFTTVADVYQEALRLIAERRESEAFLKSVRR